MSVNVDGTTLAYGSIAVAITCLIGYHIFLYVSTFVGGTQTQLSMNLKNANHWVFKRRDVTDAPTTTLAIQTIRNTIIVAVFVGGSALSAALSYADDYPNHANDPIQQARIIILTSLFMLSFLSWATVIRFASHLGYLVDTLGRAPKAVLPPFPQSSTLSSPVEMKVPDTVAGTVDGKQADGAEKLGVSDENKPAAIDHAATAEAIVVNDPTDNAVKQCIRIVAFLLFSFSFGFRFLFIALPFAFLSMGSLGLIISTFVILCFLWFYDYGYLMVPLPSPEQLK